MVALSDCTDAIRDIPFQSPVPSPERISCQLPPNPLVPEDNLFANTTSSPRPSSNISFRKHRLNPSLEAVVVLNDCTAVNRDIPPLPPNPIPTPITSHVRNDPPIISQPIHSHQQFTDSSVALMGLVMFPIQTSPLTLPILLRLEQLMLRIPPSGPVTANPSAPSSDEIPFHPNPDVENVPEFVRIWSSKITSASDFDAFCNTSEDLATAVVDKGKEMSSNNSGRRRTPRPASNRPNRRDPHPNRSRLQNNPIEARCLQMLFHISKKRAARKILKDNTTVYTGSKDQAHQYFSDTFATKHVDIDELVESLHEHVPSANEDPNLMAPFTAKDIRRKLMSMSNSAPGKDRVEYRHLKLMAPYCSWFSIDVCRRRKSQIFGSSQP